MPVVRYVGNAGQYRLTQSGVDIEAGDTAAVNDDVAEYLLERDDFELAEASEPDEDVHEEDGPPDSIDVDDATVSELRDAASYIDDADTVRELLEYERANKERATAIDTLESRIDDLED